MHLELKNKVKEYRAEKEMTQESLAEKAEVTRQTIISIEKSVYQPSVTLALKLSRVLKCKVEDLFFIE